MATYKITHNTTGKVVNLFIEDQTGSVPNGTRVSLYSWQDNNDQKWVVEDVGISKLLRLARDTNKVLNRHSTNNRAHVWDYDNSTATQNDSLVQFVTTNGYTRIKLVHHNMYLTKNASDNYLSWTTESANDRQYFTITEVDTSSSTRTQIDIPSNRRCNWNQFYNEIVNAIGSDAGCAWTCGLDIANMYGPIAYDPISMASAWVPGVGYAWTVPSGCPVTFSGYQTCSTDTAYLAAIRAQININRPVIVRMIGSNGVLHFVVAYGYTGNGDSTTLINVFDPARDPDEEGVGEEPNGRITTLAEAITFNGKTHITGYKTVSVN